MRESNSHQRFWRPLSYHLTNPLHYLPYTFKTSYRLLDFLSSLIPTYSLRKTLRSTTLRFVSLDLLRKSLSESPIIFADKSARCFPIHPSFFSAFSRLSPRPISNSQLHVLPHFHLCPIYLVVFKGSYSRRREISS